MSDTNPASTAQAAPAIISKPLDASATTQAASTSWLGYYITPEHIKHSAELVSAFAALLWPAILLYIVLRYREQIGAVLSKLKKLKIFGHELETVEEKVNELAESASNLEEKLESVESSVDVSYSIGEAEKSVVSEDAETIRNILSEAARSPKLGLILLATEIERRLHIITLCSGWPLRGQLKDALATLHGMGLLSTSVINSVDIFREVRNKIIHGRNVDRELTVAAIDSGVTLLRALQTIPLSRSRVVETRVDLFADEQCSQMRMDFHGVMLQEERATGERSQPRVYPTTKAHFQAGKVVSWEWNMDKVFDKSWYKPPGSQTCTIAFDSSAEFVGEHFD